MGRFASQIYIGDTRCPCQKHSPLISTSFGASSLQSRKPQVDDSSGLCIEARSVTTREPDKESRCYCTRPGGDLM